jgi:hypothetical protein
MFDNLLAGRCIQHQASTIQRRSRMMKRLVVLGLLLALFTPMVISLCSCEQKVKVKQEVTDDGQGNRKERIVREFK